MQKKKSIGINAVLNGIKTILSVIFPLITYPYAARILQVENMGKVDFSNSIVSYFVLIAGLGISTYAVREGARVRDNKEKLEKFVSQIFTINVLSSFLAIILLILNVLFVPKLHSYISLIIVQSLTIVGNLIGVNWIYSIEEDYAYITVRSFFIHCLALVLLFLFVHDKTDYVWYAATTVIANVGANVFNFFYAKKYISIKLTIKLNLKKHLKPILIIFASTVTTTIYVNSDKTILGLLAGEYYVGLYSVSVNIYTVLKSCVAAVILVSLPRLSNYVANHRNEDYKQTATNIFKVFLLLLMPVMVGVFVTADTIVIIIGGSTYVAATTSLQILSISLMFSMLATYYTNAVLLPMKQEIVVLKGTFLSAVINVLLNCVFLSSLKQDGAALTTLIAEIIMFSFQYVYAKKYIRMQMSKKFVFSIFYGCMSIILISWLCNILITNLWIRLFVKISVSAVTYALILLIMKNDAVILVIKSVKLKFGGKQSNLCK